MKRVYSGCMAAGGLLLMVIGMVLLRSGGDGGAMMTLPYICIGLGSGVFGHGMGNIVSKKALKNSPELEKQMEIEQKDERNVAIANRAKAKAYDIMIFVFGALMVSFAIMNVELRVTLLLVFAYLFVAGCGVWYRIKYEKEM